VLQTVLNRLGGAERSDIRLVVCDLSASPYVDLAGSRMLHELHGELAARGIALRIVGAHGWVRDLLRADGVGEKAGGLDRAATLDRLLATGRRSAVLLVFAGIAALCAHTVAIQLRLYEAGVCQTRFLADVDAVLARQPPESRGIVVVPEDTVRVGIAIRSVFGRDPYMRNGQPIVTFDAPDQQPGNAAARVRMTAACALRP
jgi:hypothetical protein